MHQTESNTSIQGISNFKITSLPAPQLAPALRYNRMCTHSLDKSSLLTSDLCQTMFKACEQKKKASRFVVKVVLTFLVSIGRQFSSLKADYHLRHSRVAAS